MIEVAKISGIGEFSEKVEKIEKQGGPEQVRRIFLRGEKAFLVENLNTIEVRTDAKLAKLLREKYESVMESRYFGKGGIEIVSHAGQLDEAEIEDLVRLSYNLT